MSGTDEKTLHDRMVAVLFDVWQNPGPGPVFFPEPMTDAILAMPEMQAIRRFIKAYADSTAEDSMAVGYAFDDLPASVDQWAEGAA